MSSGSAATRTQLPNRQSKTLAVPIMDTPRAATPERWNDAMPFFDCKRLPLPVMCHEIMKARQLARTAALALVCQLLSCSTQPQTTGKNGHWETVPPVTGSLIERRVWVEDGQ